MLVEGHPEWSYPDRARTDVRPQVTLKMCTHARTTPLWHRYTQNGISVWRKTTRRGAGGHDPIVISPAGQTGVTAPERAPHPKSSVLQTEKVNSKQPDRTPRAVCRQPFRGCASRQRSTITSHSPWMSTISTCPGWARMACTPARRRSSCRRGGAGLRGVGERAGPDPLDGVVVARMRPGVGVAR